LTDKDFPDRKKLRDYKYIWQWIAAVGIDYGRGKHGVHLRWIEAVFGLLFAVSALSAAAFIARPQWTESLGLHKASEAYSELATQIGRIADGTSKLAGAVGSLDLELHTRDSAAGTELKSASRPGDQNGGATGKHRAPRGHNGTP
jgi:hypothetical protein